MYTHYSALSSLSITQIDIYQLPYASRFKNLSVTVCKLLITMNFDDENFLGSFTINAKKLIRTFLCFLVA